MAKNANTKRTKKFFKRNCSKHTHTLRPTFHKKKSLQFQKMFNSLIGENIKMKTNSLIKLMNLLIKKEKQSANPLT